EPMVGLFHGRRGPHLFRLFGGLSAAPAIDWRRFPTAVLRSENLLHRRSLVRYGDRSANIHRLRWRLYAFRRSGKSPAEHPAGNGVDVPDYGRTRFARSLCRSIDMARFPPLSRRRYG